jgi:hypothetical protein
MVSGRLVLSRVMTLADQLAPVVHLRAGVEAAGGRQLQSDRERVPGQLQPQDVEADVVDAQDEHQQHGEVRQQVAPTPEPDDHPRPRII